MQSTTNNSASTSVSGSTSSQIFNIGSASVYSYNSTPQSNKFSNNSSTNNLTYNNNTTNTSTTTNNQTQIHSSYVDIQAQFELSIELRKFINIDLFQRGYYQIRLSVKCSNKQIPTKIMLQIENQQSNQNLSDVMFPSTVIDDYAVSKTFLILYKNEEIILDDHFVFKISALLNAFNLIDSFEKLGLELNIELWFTENDYKPPINLISLMNGSLNSTPQQQQQQQQQNNSNNFSNLESPDLNNSPISVNNASLMQQLCSRNFKIKFDPRYGLHLQLPCVFDYFHLSSVIVTLHCNLLTLLPPVMLGTNLQRNLTLSSILFGKDLSQFKNINEITSSLLNRAVYLHNQICTLLLTSYENLQDHILKMCSHLNEYERKNIKIDYVDCKEKLKKLCEIVQNCSDAETIDDLANRHIAQCSAENIMLWCLYLDNFSLNLTTSPYLAIDYHTKRLKRFSESFVQKDIAKKNLLEFSNESLQSTDNLSQLYDLIRQSSYYQQLPDLIVSCDELDGLAEQLPIIFEENYVSYLQSSPTYENSSKSVCESISNQKSSSSFSSFRSSSNRKSMNKSEQRKTSQSSNEYSSASSSSNPNSNLSSSSTKLHKRLKKKLMNTGDILDLQTEKNKSIQLVSYRKTKTEYDLIENIDLTLSSAQLKSSPVNNEQLTIIDSLNHKDRLSRIKADLATKLSTPSSSSSTSSLQSNSKQTTMTSNSTSISEQINQINPSNQANIYAASASDLLFGTNLDTPKKDISTTIPEINTDFSSLSLNQIDMSLNDNNNNNNNDSITSIDHDKLSTPIINKNLESIDKQGPLDCSFKSRALYESFRGKISTLERPKRHQNRKTILNNSFISNNNNNQLTSTNIAYENDYNKETLNRKQSIKSSKETKIIDLLKTELEQSTILDESSPPNPPPRHVKKSLNKQLSIYSNKNSLTSNITNETLLKFVLAREDLKKQLFLKYQNSNLYSEFSSFFCTAPYFYPELTPKLSPSNSINKLNDSSKLNKQTNLRSSFMSTITSKSKLFRQMFNKENKNNQSLNNESDLDDDVVVDEDDNNNNNDDDDEDDEDEGIHLVICVHGLDGNSGDLRLVRTYLELALPGAKMDFLMSEHNQESTFDDIEVMTEQLIREIENHLESYGIDPYRISFIGHSLGNLIVRSTVAHDKFKPYVNKLYTYLSLSGPHLGTLYNSSGLINMGLWIMQKWKKSGSLLQLSLKDNQDLKKTFLYKLSKKPTFEYFKNILLVASPQDRYVPFHSARVDMCKSALKDSVYGNVYREMLTNILKPIQDNSSITFKRYNAFYSLPNGTSNLIGRAAHVAVLDSELFVEKLILVSVAKYFR